MHCTVRKSLAGVTSAAAALLFASSAWAQVPISGDNADEVRDFDARIEHNRGVALQMGEPQAAAIEAMRSSVPDFTMRWDRTMGTVTTLASHTTYLSGPAEAGQAPLQIALDYVNANLGALGLSSADVAEYRVTDSVRSPSGATHLYLEQMYKGIPVYGAALHVNLSRDGKILSVNNSFVPNLEAAVNTGQPALGAPAAMLSAMGNVGVKLDAAPAPLGAAQGVQQLTRFSGEGMSTEGMEAKLVYLPVGAAEVRLAWNIGTMWTLDGQHTYEFNVDAQDGKVWTRFDTTSTASYRVFGQPVEVPTRTSPAFPADGRRLVVNPENRKASPNGWLAADNSPMSGANNNVLACTDRNADNVCDADVPQPTCANGVCDFAHDFRLEPLATNPASAIANLFYWNNIIHDIQYQYGFDEQSGNFQNNTFGRGGVGNDAVFAQAQDGGGNCNANFSTPADGRPGRMQMFLCNRATPMRDGDFDNGVIVHEYGHGISTRQVGGANRTQASCLRGEQQAGEGWSDWLGLVYTALPTDTAPQARGTGTFLFNRDPDGDRPTIRDLPYSTDNNVNDWTYESIQMARLPHGVGSRWAQAIWEVYWALVDKHGFEADLVNFDINDRNEAGNKRALYYINEGFKNSACPQTGITFIDNRNGVMQAVMDSFGGEDVCTVWQTFAAFGLGIDASTADSMRISARNGFQVPAACRAR